MALEITLYPKVAYVLTAGKRDCYSVIKAVSRTKELYYELQTVFMRLLFKPSRKRKDNGQNNSMKHEV